MAILAPALLQLGVVLWLGGQQVQRIDTLEEVNVSLANSLSGLKVDYIERDRRIWERIVGVEKNLSHSREDVAALKATLKHISNQLNRIESKVDRPPKQ